MLVEPAWGIPLSSVEYHWSLIATLFPPKRYDDLIKLSGYDGVIANLSLSSIEVSCPI